MKRHRDDNLSELRASIRAGRRAFARAAHYARREHKLHGVPLVVCDKNGKVIEIPPEKIVVGPDPALNPPKRPKPATTKTRRSTKKLPRR